MRLTKCRSPLQLKESVALAFQSPGTSVGVASLNLRLYLSLSIIMIFPFLLLFPYLPTHLTGTAGFFFAFIIGMHTTIYFCASFTFFFHYANSLIRKPSRTVSMILQRYSYSGFGTLGRQYHHSSPYTLYRRTWSPIVIE